MALTTKQQNIVEEYIVPLMMNKSLNIDGEDFEQLLDKWGLPYIETAIYLYEKIAPAACKGCKYIRFYADLHPCIFCSRVPRKDYYEERKYK
jgi:hypothetical protein